MDDAAIEEWIRKLVAEAPPLTAEQRDKLALLLRSGLPKLNARSGTKP